MQIDLWMLVVGGLAVLFFGYFFGLFEGRDQGYKKGRAEGASPDSAALPQETQPRAPAGDTKPGLLHLMEEDGRLRLELGGEELNPGTLPAEQRKRLIETVARLRPWIDAPAQPQEAPPPVPPPAASSAAQPPSPTRPAASAQEAPAPASSMVGQIDEILQQNIAGTPLAERGLRLVEEPGGGVMVKIDATHYASIGEVTEPEVQAALRRAISLWEKKYTPGT